MKCPTCNIELRNAVAKEAHRIIHPEHFRDET